MKLFILTLALLFATSSPVSSQSPNAKQPASTASQTRAEKKLEREILKVESQFRQALAKCDTAALERLLADYYADSYAGGGRAVGKKGTIARCHETSVPYYSIEKDRKISVRADIVVIEGYAEARPESGSDVQEEERSDLFVKRYWTRKNGRWQLVAQTVAEPDMAS